MVIVFNTLITSRFTVRVAEDDGVVCFVSLDCDSASDELSLIFSESIVEMGSLVNTEKVIAAIDGLIDAKSIPLKLKGTPFSKLVWNYLRTIPVGTTMSYSQVASALGRPTSIRAVASACARNHIALLIPCHRVIGSSGSLTGYKWGLDTKKKLLEAEKDRAAATLKCTEGEK